MVKFYDDKNAVLFLYYALKHNGFDWPPEAGDANTENYERKVRRLLIENKWSERNADVFINNVQVAYKKSMPSEEELRWFLDDPRASYWFLYKVDNQYLSPVEQSFSLEGNSLLNGTEPSGKNLPPVHSARVEFIKDKIRKSLLNTLTRDNVLNAHREWNDLITRQNIFSDVNSKSGITPDWLLSYLKENNILLREYMSGDSIDEKLSYCYASYFIWYTWFARSDAEKELFIKKFKSALSTQKSREKKKQGKNKVLNVSVSEETHDKLRRIAEIEGISNARIIEYAINLAWQQKNSKHLK
ncbi:MULTISPECIES: hypothetical protein [Enterobacterales]|uniref:hypothetical protein n=1 Tax=Enterobacterales TaxID=91347 RepID=UPI0022F10B10|nr:MULTISPECIES: hypothetical protein [Enterobacteriaceae]MDA4642502.1 hypothetical protein [Enterobacter hormaechei]MDA4842302.1 hypothetical protein [Enterobacter hormaechei]